MEIPKFRMPEYIDDENMTNYLLAVIADELKRMNDISESQIKC
jgi:hypothetical protein